MSLELQILERISLYVEGQIDVSDLESWLSAVTWQIDDEPDAIRRLAFDALRLTSETANGDWTEDQLRLQLEALAESVTDGATLVLWDASLVADEQFLGKISVAQRAAPGFPDKEAALLDLMRYAHLSTHPLQSDYWFGSGQPSGRAFLGRSKAENETPPRGEAQLV
jgi:hypothetical protein